MEDDLHRGGFCGAETDEHGRAVADRHGKAVMVPTLRFHDFRRSAARNLRRAGIGPDVGMKITGHETDSIWRRYSIVAEGNIERALDPRRPTLPPAPTCPRPPS